MENNSIYKKSIQVQDASDELKVQYSIDLSPWDSSKIEGYKEGSEIKKGYSCKIATLKPNKKYSKARIDIDPANIELRTAIREMYEAFDKVTKK